LFGSVHAVNGFLTGDFAASLLQALQATLTGVWLQSLRLRTKSIHPAMLVHGLWDCAIFILNLAVINASGGAGGGPSNSPFMQQFIFAVLMPMPLFLYGLWLLRGIGKKDKAELLS
jgi:hypothetical protein